MNYTFVARLEKKPVKQFVISENVYFAKRYDTKELFCIVLASVIEQKLCFVHSI